ncbi:hypothetical protein BpHYR1_022080 [Brachionus plicatilis]|uniref:Uncharacterized protein n=1 Tax=Brachionus plicatilis TaxID=10195 RepID=A0A3M7S5W9_BRAPC|nr:hypothetical protein BpHYR1_022080 [Brachionus plicatilis]
MKKKKKTHSHTLLRFEDDELMSRQADRSAFLILAVLTNTIFVFQYKRYIFAIHRQIGEGAAAPSQHVNGGAQAVLVYVAHVFVEHPLIEIVGRVGAGRLNKTGMVVGVLGYGARHHLIGLGERAQHHHAELALHLFVPLAQKLAAHHVNKGEHEGPRPVQVGAHQVHVDVVYAQFGEDLDAEALGGQRTGVRGGGERVDGLVRLANDPMDEAVRVRLDGVLVQIVQVERTRHIRQPLGHRRALRRRLRRPPHPPVNEPLGAKVAGTVRVRPALCVRVQRLVGGHDQLVCVSQHQQTA